MSKKQKNRRKKQSAQPQSAVQSSSLRKWTLLVAIALAGLLIGIGVRRATQSPSPVAANDSSTVATIDEADPSSKPSTLAMTEKTVFDAVLGKWVRSEGGYVLDIRAVDAKGKLDAVYLNPRPIHIAKAEATRSGAPVKVFIELQDVNYPGSTYELTFDPASDQLRGVYFQAVEQESFEVTFSRTEKGSKAKR